MLAWTILRTVSRSPSDAKLSAASSAIRAVVDDCAGKQDLSADGRKLLDVLRDTGNLRSELAAAKSEIERAHSAAGTDLQHHQEERRRLLVENSALADEASNAKILAKTLWRAMPAEGRLAYFESPEAWLPGWIRGDD